MNETVTRIGTAGWAIRSHHADYFPGTCTHIERYARQLNAVEINSSFYRPHRRATYERWAASVPENFRFAVKAPKSITHVSRLRDYGSLLSNFVEESEGLGEKLGVILVQLPPSLTFDPAVVSAFFQDIRRRTSAAIACEPRHRSWFTGAGDACLNDVEVARVAADPPPVAGADEPGGWPGLIYYRLHGAPRIYYSDYGPAALETMRERLRQSRIGNIPAWCIFDNTALYAATGNALTLSAMVREETNGR